MGLLEMLKEAGFEPTLSTDGEFKPYVGTYKVLWKVCRPEVDKNNGDAKYVQAEWDIAETLEGDPKRESQFNAFRKRYYFEPDGTDERGASNLKALLDAAFNFGVDLDRSSAVALYESFKTLIEKPGYIRAWAWTPDKTVDGTPIPAGQRKARQMFVFQKPEVAEKKRSDDSLSF